MIPALASGQRVHIHGRHGEVLGVIGALSIHMQGGLRPQVPELHELFIDIGAASRKEAEKRVAVGDLITYIVGWQQLAGDIYIARACDNRIGTFVAAEVMRLCAQGRQAAEGLPGGGLGGRRGERTLWRADDRLFGEARRGAGGRCRRRRPTSRSANRKRFGDTRLGAGPILSRGSVNHPVLVKRLEEVAIKQKIAFQRGIDPRRSGTDADAIFLQRGGIASAAIGVPNRYMHTPVEAVHLGDLETSGRVADGVPAGPRSAGKFQGEDLAEGRGTELRN